MNMSTQFSMHTTYPKRDYTQQDMDSTLRELQLAPTATLLILPVGGRSSAAKKLSNMIPTSASSSSSSGGAVATSSSILSDIASLIFLPITIVWGIVSSFFGFGTNQARSSTAGTPSGQATSSRSNQQSNESISE